MAGNLFVLAILVCGLLVLSACVPSSPENLVPERCIVDMGLGCEEFSIKGSQVSMKLINYYDERVEIRNVTLSSDKGACYFNPAQPLEVEAGSDTLIVVNDCAWLEGMKGERARISVETVYFRGADFDRFAKGEITGRVQ